MGYIDFQELKQTVEIYDCALQLGLELKKTGDAYRCACPACKGSDRSLVVSPDRQVFYCHESNKGGDLISLVAHVKGVSVKEAARLIVSGMKPQKPEETQTRTFEPLTYLEHDHEALAVLGLDTDTAIVLGIGYAKKGMMRGRVAVPIRLEDGKLVGYIGITEAKLPNSWQL